MKVYRYNTKQRTDRKFNTSGREKNPNNIRFFVRSLEAAEEYRYVYSEDGDIIYECELQVEEVEGNFFDMEANFRSLDTYKNYINAEVGIQRRDYTEFLNNAKTQKQKKHWEAQIANLANRESELVDRLKAFNFQFLSDGEIQHDLISELKGKGFDGYITRDEVAIF